MAARRRWTEEELSRIYDKTGGYCRYCDKKLAWRNYGPPGARAAWQVDHSIPVSRGGTDHMNNLFPACILCNQEKGDMTGSEFQRLFHGSRSSQPSPWEGLVVVAIGALALGALIKALRGNSWGTGSFGPR